MLLTQDQHFKSNGTIRITIRIHQCQTNNFKTIQNHKLTIITLEYIENHKTIFATYKWDKPTIKKGKIIQKQKFLRITVGFITP